MLVINFPIYILIHSLLFPVQYIHSMNYLPELTWACDLAGPWFHHLRKFCQVGNNSNTQASNSSPLEMLNQAFQNYHSAPFGYRFILNHNLWLCRPWGPGFLISPWPWWRHLQNDFFWTRSLSHFFSLHVLFWATKVKFHKSSLMTAYNIKPLCHPPTLNLTYFHQFCGSVVSLITRWLPTECL